MRPKKRIQHPQRLAGALAQAAAIKGEMLLCTTEQAGRIDRARAELAAEAEAAAAGMDLVGGLVVGVPSSSSSFSSSSESLLPLWVSMGPGQAVAAAEAAAAEGGGAAAAVAAAAAVVAVSLF